MAPKLPAGNAYGKQETAGKSFRPDDCPGERFLSRPTSGYTGLLGPLGPPSHKLSARFVRIICLQAAWPRPVTTDIFKASPASPLSPVCRVSVASESFRGYPGRDNERRCVSRKSVRRSWLAGSKSTLLIAGSYRVFLRSPGNQTWRASIERVMKMILFLFVRQGGVISQQCW